MIEIRTIAVMGATGRCHLTAHFSIPIANIILGRQGRGVVDALTSSTKGAIKYHVRPLTRFLTSKHAQEFAHDYPQLSLMQWNADDTSTLLQCFAGCYGAFIDFGVLALPKSSLKEWTRKELALGERCRQAAEVNNKHFPSPFPSQEAEQKKEEEEKKGEKKKRERVPG